MRRPAVILYYLVLSIAILSACGAPETQAQAERSPDSSQEQPAQGEQPGQPQVSVDASNPGPEVNGGAPAGDFALSGSGEDSIQPYVFRVRVWCESAGNEKDSPVITLTGFFAEGYPGLITALHGVTECFGAYEPGCVRADISESDYQARPDAPLDRQYECLRISRLDIEKDIVMLDSSELSSDKLEYWKQGGLAIGEKIDYLDCLELHEVPARIFGYAGQNVAAEKLLPDISCTPTLFDLINDSLELFRLLGQRESPVTSTRVLRLNTDPPTYGQSGAPIMRWDTNELIGVVIGGLPGRMAWGIPWHDITWHSLDDQVTRERLSKLIGRPVPRIGVGGEFFANVPLDGPPGPKSTQYIEIPETQDWQGDIVTDELLSSRDGYVAVFTGPFHDEEKLLLARSKLTGGVESSKPIGLISLDDIPIDRRPDYREFCDRISDSEFITLYAYLFEDMACTKLLTVPGQGETKAIFQIKVGPAKRYVGFCNDLY